MLKVQPVSSLMAQPEAGHTSFLFEGDGGADRDRTDDILLAKQALSQLSYSPICSQLHSRDGGPG